MVYYTATQVACGWAGAVMIYQVGLPYTWAGVVVQKTP